MSKKIGRWFGLALAVAWIVLFVAVSSGEAQIKYNQRGYFGMDYKVGINVSKAVSDRDFRTKETVDFGLIRGRLWNDWRLGESARVTWMFEADILYGVICAGGRKAESACAFTSANNFRGDIVNIETGELYLDVTVPGTDWHVQGGQVPFIQILPVWQDRTTGIKIFKAGGWIRPTFLYVPDDKTRSGLVTANQADDNHVFATWFDVRPTKEVFVKPYFFWQNRKNDGGGTEFDQQNAFLGFQSEWKGKRWFVNYLQAFSFGERDFDSPAISDRDIFAWANELGIGYRWGVNLLRTSYIHRSGQNPQNTGKLTAWSPIVTFFQQKNRVTQLLSSSFQNPAFDLEIAGVTGPNSDFDAGFNIWSFWWERPINKKTDIYVGYSHLRTDKRTDTNGNGRSDNSRHVGDAFDLMATYKVAKGLRFSAGTAMMIPGDALDSGASGTPALPRSANAPCCIWTAFVSALLRF